MKKILTNLPFYKIFLTYFVFLFCLCCFARNNLSGYQTNNQQSKKVVLLILRVGNAQAFTPMTQISFKTDYSIRAPKSGIDVFIDDETRLRESVPTYPKYTGNTKEYYIEYFRNISTEIYNGVKGSFEQKGYEVLDLKQISKTWSKPFSEMNVNDILSAVQNNADYLFVLHYMDIGNSNINSKFYKINSINSGFTSLIFTYSMFEIKKLKRLFSYSPLVGFATTPSLIYNQEIMNNPDFRKRIKVNCKKENSENTTEITHDFSDNELIQILMNNILNGFQCYGKKFIDCLDAGNSVYDIKGLLSKIP